MERAKNPATLLLALALIVGALTLNQANAQEPNQAGLVIHFGDGRTETRCIEFAEEEISGYEVLLRSGLEVVVAGGVGMGSVVCSIDGDGCPVDNCWCQCKTMGSDCTYWSYWHVDGEWVYAQMGMGGHLVRQGDVEGWRWGKTEPPSAVTFEEICTPPATDTPTPTKTPTASPTTTPMPTDTPASTATWTSAPTPLPPTETPLPTDTPPPTATATATEEPPSTPTTEALLLAATTPTASPAATRGEAPAQGGKAPPSDTPLPATDVPSSTPTPAVQNVDTATPESSQIPTPAATPQPPTETPTLETVVPPTGTPVVVALATVSTGETEGNSSQSGGGGESGGRANRLLAILSIGAGVAYLFFGLFVVALAAIYVVVRRR